MAADTSSSPALFPSTRFGLAIACFLGCMTVYMLRTSLSMAIVCMVPKNASSTVARCPGQEEVVADGSSNEAIVQGALGAPMGDFDWSSEVQGQVMGAFFYGYLCSQVLGGMMAARYGGKRVILWTVLPASIFTLMSPIAARTHHVALIFLRGLIGFLQGAVFPAMHAMWSVWAPPQESSVLTSVSYAGTQFGNILVLPLGGFLCKYGFDGGWPSIFYLLGFIGLAWCGVWQFLASDRPATHPRISEEERTYIESSLEKSMGKASAKPRATPWRAILTSRAVWAAWVGHFAGDWGAYTMLVSLPKFLSDVLGLDIQALGIVSAIPYIAYFVVINVGGFLSDFVRSRGLLSTLNMRRAAMLIALVGQAFFLVLSAYCSCGQDVLVIIYLTFAMALSGLQFSGFVVNYLDIAPPFSGTIMGIGNTISCLGGIVSPMITGFIVQEGTKEEWQTVMWLTAGILVTGTLLFCAFAKGEVEPWARSSGASETEMEALNTTNTEENAEAPKESTK